MISSHATATISVRNFVPSLVSKSYLCGSIGLQMWVMLQLKLLGTPWRGYGSYSSTFTFVSTAISTSESALVHLIGAKTPDM
jgi:hypothetical protein